MVTSGHIFASRSSVIKKTLNAPESILHWSSGAPEELTVEAGIITYLIRNNEYYCTAYTVQLLQLIVPVRGSTSFYLFVTYFSYIHNAYVCVAFFVSWYAAALLVRQLTESDCSTCLAIRRP